MARMNRTTPYQGRGQKDLSDRKASLHQLGVVGMGAAATRRQVADAERSLGLTWIGGENSEFLGRGHARKVGDDWEQVTASDGYQFCRLIDLEEK